jgi:DNA-directed RNA polymerase delta subunit
MRRLVADDLHSASAKTLEIRQNAKDLLEVYKKLFENLTVLYNEFPMLYQEIQRVVKLPTNEDAQDVVQFYQDLLQELELLKDSENLELVLRGNSLDFANDEEE